MPELQKVSDAVVEGDAAAAEQATRAALDGGLSAAEILKQGLIPAMDVVGQKMKAGEYYLPEVLLSSRAFVNFPSRGQYWEYRGQASLQGVIRDSLSTYLSLLACLWARNECSLPESSGEASIGGTSNQPKV